MSILSKFQEKFKVQEYRIFETDFWVWSLRPHQPTIGSGILSLKRECSNFGDLEASEYCDLKNIIKVIESALKNGFNYDVINYLMLMMVDKHVHYHVLPRYENGVHFLGVNWNDGSWPGIPLLSGESLSNEQLEDITEYIKSKV